jgi:hypothetical protein
MLLGFGIIGLSLGLAAGVGYIIPEPIQITEEEITTFKDMLAV